MSWETISEAISDLSSKIPSSEEYRRLEMLIAAFSDDARKAEIIRESQSSRRQEILFLMDSLGLKDHGIDDIVAKIRITRSKSTTLTTFKAILGDQEGAALWVKLPITERRSLEVSQEENEDG